MGRFLASDSTGQFPGFSDLGVTNTDNAGKFIYNFVEPFTQPPNVQCQPVSPAAGVLSPANALTATIQSVSTTQVTGIVTGVSALSIAGVSVLGVTAISTSVAVQIMAVGR